MILFVCLPKFCIGIAFIFSWDHSKSLEKMETIFMQKFGGTNKEYYGIFESCLLNNFPATHCYVAVENGMIISPITGLFS